MRQGYLAWLKTRLRATHPEPLPATPLQCHHACTKPCERPAACGHACPSPCHHGRDCPPCVRQCWIGCAHRGGPRRLPCDERCTKLLLPCGHRCPGLCGEECPPAKFCVEPECKAKAPQGVKDMQVDMVMMSTFDELTPSELDLDPLVVLRCGHAFLTSTMDGIMDLPSAYERHAVGSSAGAGSSKPPGSGSESGPGSGSGSVSVWTAPKMLSGELQRAKGCPTCRAPITGVNRYGRIVNKSVLDLIDRKHMALCGQALSQAQTRLAEVQALVRGPPVTATGHENAAAAAASASAGGSSAASVLSRQLSTAASLIQASSGQRSQGSKTDVTLSLVRPAQSAANFAIGCANLFTEVCVRSQHPPKQRVYEAVLSRIQKGMEWGGGGGCDSSGNALSHAMEGAFLGSAPMDAVSGVVDAAGQAQPAAAASASASDLDNAAVRLLVARETAGTMKPDLSQLATAQLGILSCALLAMEAATAGLMALDQALASTLFSSAPDPTTPRWQGGVAGQQGDTKPSLYGVAELQQQADRLAKQAQSAFSTTYRWATLGCVPHGSAPAQAGWIPAAASARSHNSAFKLSHGLMQLLVGRVVSLNEVKRGKGNVKVAVRKEVLKDLLLFAQQGGSSSSGAGSASPPGAGDGVSAHFLNVQEALLDQVQEVGRQTLTLYRNSPIGLKGQRNTSIDSVTALLERLPALRELIAHNTELEEAQEMASVLGAAMGLPDGSTDVMAYLRGHLYRCPNGHFYLIGNCGMAMERAVCAECGASVGGGSHTLTAGNTSAADEVARLEATIRGQR
ncbi:MAG: hypothetical protein WDW38_008643 [Sanguina aurantia]